MPSGNLPITIALGSQMTKDQEQRAARDELAKRKRARDGRRRKQKEREADALRRFKKTSRAAEPINAQWNIKVQRRGVGLVPLVHLLQKRKAGALAPAR
jgi:hypothetical protein